MSILTVKNLSKSFTSGLWPFKKRTTIDIVKSISFDVNPGEIVGLLGPNGAGKTTTIQMLLDSMTPSAGSITYFDMPFTGANRTKILKKIGYASGYEKLPARLTVWENLDIIGRMYGFPYAKRIKRIDEMLEAFSMSHVRTRETGALSAGQSTRIMLAKAFFAQPNLVLLDEPTASLDPEAAQKVRNFIIKQQKEQHTALFITSHNMAEVSELCDRVLVLKQGSIIANATPESLAGSVSQARVHLVIENGLQPLISYLAAQKIPHIAHAHEIEIRIDEHSIASFLMVLAQRNISYSSIAIDKPTLEDYFLSIAKN
jgi:ABC-2 type transport system ATP-binding protein